MVTILDVTEDNVDDIFKICSYENRFNVKSNQKGIKIKRKWLKTMLRNHGPCAKIAYLDETPVAQITYYPEEAAPYIKNPRKNVIFLHCIYNSSQEAQRKGVATTLMKEIVNECKTEIQCLGCKACSFMVTQIFPNEGDLTLTDFYEKHGFNQGNMEMFLEVHDSHYSRNIPEYQSIEEDLEKATLFYTPACEWGYYHVHEVEKDIREFDPDFPIDIYNVWEAPGEFIKRFLPRMTSGVSIIKGQIFSPPSFWTDRELFKLELAQLLEK